MTNRSANYPLYLTLLLAKVCEIKLILPPKKCRYWPETGPNHLTCKHKWCHCFSSFSTHASGDERAPVGGPGRPVVDGCRCRTATVLLPVCCALPAGNGLQGCRVHGKWIGKFWDKLEQWNHQNRTIEFGPKLAADLGAVFASVNSIYGFIFGLPFFSLEGNGSFAKKINSFGI